MAEKRKRGQNFSLEDKDKLIKLLLLHKETILNKKTDGTTNESKNDAWNAITHSFTHSKIKARFMLQYVDANKESLVKLWEKLKSESKLYFSKIRNSNTQTGGGPLVVKFDPLLEQVCSILGRGCSGILGVPDSDAEIAVVADYLPRVAQILPNSINADGNSMRQAEEIEVLADLQAPMKLIETPVRAPRQVDLSKINDVESIQIIPFMDESHIENTQESPKIIKNKTPLWSRRRPHISTLNERSEASVSSSINKVYKKKENIEDLKEQLLREELDFKRKLYELQLQAAAKEVEIKTAVLNQIKSEGFSLRSLYEGQRKKDDENV